MLLGSVAVTVTVVVVNWKNDPDGGLYDSVTTEPLLSVAVAGGSYCTLIPAEPVGAVTLWFGGQSTLGGVKSGPGPAVNKHRIQAIVSHNGSFNIHCDTYMPASLSPRL